MMASASVSAYATSEVGGSVSPVVYKLIDFGSALDLDRPADSLDSYTNTLSTAGPDARMEGTEPYLSPEMLRFAAAGSMLDPDTAERLTCKLDVWSLGATLLQLATGIMIIDRTDASSFGVTKRKLKEGTWDLKTDLLDTRYVS